MLDLEQRRPVDLLPERTAAVLKTWLRQHPGVRVIARDRGPDYSRGATAGAPHALQVADQFHLLVRRITHPSIPIADGKGSGERLWVNG